MKNLKNKDLKNIVECGIAEYQYEKKDRSFLCVGNYTAQKILLKMGINHGYILSDTTLNGLGHALGLECNTLSNKKKWGPADVSTGILFGKHEIDRFFKNLYRFLRFQVLIKEDPRLEALRTIDNRAYTGKFAFVYFSKYTKFSPYYLEKKIWAVIESARQTHKVRISIEDAAEALEYTSSRSKAALIAFAIWLGLKKSEYKKYSQFRDALVDLEVRRRKAQNAVTESFPLQSDEEFIHRSERKTANVSEVIQVTVLPDGQKIRTSDEYQSPLPDWEGIGINFKKIKISTYSKQISTFVAYTDESGNAKYPFSKQTGMFAEKYTYNKYVINKLVCLDEEKYFYALENRTNTTLGTYVTKMLSDNGEGTFDPLREIRKGIRGFKAAEALSKEKLLDAYTTPNGISVMMRLGVVKDHGLASCRRHIFTIECIAGSAEVIATDPIFTSAKSFAESDLFEKAMLYMDNTADLKLENIMKRFAADGKVIDLPVLSAAKVCREGTLDFLKSRGYNAVEFYSISWEDLIEILKTPKHNSSETDLLSSETNYLLSIIKTVDSEIDVTPWRNTELCFGVRNIALSARDLDPSMSYKKGPKRMDSELYWW